MTTAKFFTLFALVTLLALLGVALLHGLLVLDYAWGFTVATLFVLVLITLLTFFLGRRSAGAKNKLLFGNVFLGLTMVKMLFCGMLVVGYAIVALPPDRLFILPFFWLYLVYTAFEVYFLMKLSAVVGK